MTTTISFFAVFALAMVVSAFSFCVGIIFRSFERHEFAFFCSIVVMVLASFSITSLAFMV